MLRTFWNPRVFSKCLISPQNAAAALVSRMTTITVSSPAREPTTILIFMESMAEPAALARPGKVRIMICLLYTSPSPRDCS